YSLAVVLYEILTGDMLFRADTPMQVALSHISEPPPPPRSVNPNIPESVERELLRALSKNPKERHKTASEFIGAIKDAYGTSLDKVAETAPPVGIKTLVFDKEDTFRDSVKNAVPSAIENDSTATDKPAQKTPKDSTS